MKNDCRQEIRDCVCFLRPRSGACCLALPLNLCITTVFTVASPSQASFRSYFGTMPWLAIPFEEATGDTGGRLSQEMECRGIPHLVLLNGKGEVFDMDGRSTVMNDPSGGWIPETARKWGEGQRLGGSPGAGFPSAPPLSTAVSGRDFDASSFRPEGIDEDQALAMAMAASLAEEQASRRVMADALDDDLALVRTNSMRGRVEAAVRTLGGSHAQKLTCLQTIAKILANVVKSPDPKFRSIRKGNAAVHTKILEVQGGANILRVAGFQDTIKSEDFKPAEPYFTLGADESKVPVALEVIEAELKTKKKPSAQAKRSPGGGSSGKSSDPEREAIRRRIEADKLERAQRKFTASKSQYKGFGAGEKKSATQLGADGRGGGG